MISNDLMRDIVQTIVEYADEIKADGKPDAQDYGQLLSYAECLSIIRDACGDEICQEIGLDFDIDKRYL